MRNKKITKLVICLCLLLSVLIATTYAFMSAYDSRVNRFTPGTLTLELTEENWSEINAQNMVPMQTVYKDPKVINPEGNIEAWVFTTVKVPSTNVSHEDSADLNIKGADGTILKSDEVTSYYDLFNYTVNDGWELVAVDTAHRSENKGYTTYYYVYSAEKVAGGSESTALFDTVQLNNITAVPENYKATIDVEGAGIQGNSIDTAYKAWSIYANQNNWSDLSFYRDGYSESNSTIKYN